VVLLVVLVVVLVSLPSLLHSLEVEAGGQEVAEAARRPTARPLPLMLSVPL